MFELFILYFILNLASFYNYLFTEIIIFYITDILNNKRIMRISIIEITKF